MVCADTRMNRWSLGNLRFVRIVPRLLALFQTGDRPVLFTNSSKFRSSLREVPVSKSLHETRTCKFLPTWRPPLFYYFGGIVSTFGSLKVNARFAILIGIDPLRKRHVQSVYTRGSRGRLWWRTVDGRCTGGWMARQLA